METNNSTMLRKARRGPTPNWSAPVEWCSDLHTFNASLNGRRIYTRAVLEEVAAAVDKANDPSTSEQVFLKDIHGVSRVIWDSADPALLHDGEPTRFARRLTAVPHWNRYAWLAMQRYHNDPRDSLWRWNGCPPEKITLPVELHRASGGVPSGIALRPEYVPLVLARWETSRSRRYLQNLIADVAERGVRVKKIVCFGQGTLDCGLLSYTHYLAACEIALALQELYTFTDEQESGPIPIFAQDRNNTVRDEGLLENFLPAPIHILDDPHGFLAVDKHTFVLAANSDVNVHGILADVLYPDGPAAILGNDMELDKDRRLFHPIHLGTPRVIEMLEQYELRDFDDLELPVDEAEILYDMDPWFWQMQLWFKPTDAASAEISSESESIPIEESIIVQRPYQATVDDVEDEYDII